jgi:GTP-binding protein
MNHAQMLFNQSRMRVSTGQLNRMLRTAVGSNPPPVYQNRRPKIYYATQVATQPPTLVLFCSHPAAFSDTYRRYLLNTFRDQLDFGEVPIKLYLRKRDSSDNTDEIGQSATSEA